MHIAHAIGGMNIEGGGACKYVADLANYQAEISGISVVVLTQERYASRKLLNTGVDLQSPLRSGRVGPFFQGFAEMLRAIHTKKPVDILHVHGIWLPALYELQKEAVKLGIPIMLAPHGMLEPGALTFSPWKKKLAMAFFQRKGLKLPDMIMATAGQEADNLKAFFPKKPFFESPPGLDLPARDSVKKWSPDDEDRAFLFLSRVHPKKNLLPFLEVFADEVEAKTRLLIAGPDEKGHTAEVQAKIVELNLGDRVELLGPRFGAEKTKLFQRANIFVLPSLSENFGIVVAEALAFGLPVLTTTATPWSVLNEKGLGWWVGGDKESLRDGFKAAQATKAEDLKQMGLRGREYVAGTFQWSAIAADLVSTYREMAKVGRRR